MAATHGSAQPRWRLLASVGTVCVTAWLLKRALREARRKQAGVKATVSRLVVFPVKSCAGVVVEEAVVDVGGFKNDREWVIVRDPSHLPAGNNAPDLVQFQDRVAPGNNGLASIVTLREYPRMALIQPTVDNAGVLKLQTPDGKSIVVSQLHQSHEVRLRLLLWRTECSGVDQGDDVASFINTFLECQQEPVRLLRMREAERKLVDCAKYCDALDGCDDKDTAVSKYSDWSPFTILSNQSVDWLRRRVPSVDIDTDRFRTNIVVDASQPFEEDAWDVFSVGCVQFRYLKLVGRCMVTAVDSRTGVRDKRLEPLKTLKRARDGVYEFLNKGSKWLGHENFFAVNIKHQFQPGQVIRVGDLVSVSKFRFVPQFDWW